MQRSCRTRNMRRAQNVITSNLRAYFREKDNPIQAEFQEASRKQTEGHR